VLVVWDRLFGTFQEETEPCVYGTRTPLQSWDPLWANASVYWALAQDTWRTRRWSDKLRLWLKPPGWLPADLAAMRPHKPFDLQSVTRFEPPLKRSQQWFAAAQFLLVLGAVALFLWHVDTLAWGTCALWSMALVSTLWVQGLYLQNRASAAHVVLLECATLGGLHLAGALFT
jgi:alkylglycerol monooxygenase